ncbi:MAG: DNA polymerase III subunit delta [Bacillota bacterium]
MDYRQARLELKKGNLRSLYLFSGSEDALKEELLCQMIGLMARQGLDPDLLRIDGRKMAWPELRREMEQMTIFSRGRILLVKDVPYFSAAPGKSTGAKSEKEPPAGKSSRQEGAPGEDELISILSAGTGDTLLVFSVQDVDRRRKLNKYLEKEGVLIEFPPLKGAALARWIRDELKQENRQIDEDALAVLMQRSGEDLTLLRRELEKIVTFLDSGEIIERSVVEKLVPENTQGNIFNMVDELGRKNAFAALNHFNKMRRQNEPPLRILALVTRHFRLLYRARLLQQEGLPPAKLAAALQLPPFVTAKLLEQLPNFPGESLPRIIADLKEVDLRIKTGRLPGEDALEQLVYTLAFKKVFGV